MPFCDICGRRLDSGAVFCDRCGRKVAPEEGMVLVYHEAPSQVPPLHVPSRGEPSLATSGRAGETPIIREEKGRGVPIESKPAEPLPSTQPKSRRRLTPPRRVHISRRTLILSVAAVAVIAIVALAFLGGPLTFPGLISNTQTQTVSQTSAETVTTVETGPTLDVEINFARDPISAGSTQVLFLTVRDPGGSAIPDASVHVEVLNPTGQSVVSEGSTDVNGQYSYAWHILASSDSVGTFQVTVSATKAGYKSGHAQATFQVTLG